MTVWAIVTHYMDSGLFGTYSTIKRARLAFEQFLADDENITSFEQVDGYCYHFTTVSGEEFGAEILWDVIDAEFVEGIITE
jgi:hypothetical protein